MCLVTFSGATQCFESIRAKLKFSFFLSHFTVLNKPQKLTDHERENLVFDPNCVPKGMIVSPTRVCHSKPFDWERFRFFRHKFGFGAVNVRIGIFRIATQRPRIQLTDKIQRGAAFQCKT